MARLPIYIILRRRGRSVSDVPIADVAPVPIVPVVLLVNVVVKIVKAE